MLPLNAAEVVYCETVEEKTFVYTETGMYQTTLTLAELEDRWESMGLLRCGKPLVRSDAGAEKHQYGDSRKVHHCLHRTFRLRKIHLPENFEPDERSDSRSEDHW